MNKGLGKFFTKKILKLITLLVALCIITFALMELSPIDPVTAYVGSVILCKQNVKWIKRDIFKYLLNNKLQVFEYISFFIVLNQGI